MVHQLITIAEFPEPTDTVWSAFDRKLEAAINAVETAASIRLRAEMGHGVELIRWLEGWSLRFREQHKALISIAEDPVQRQCLELSHPNMELVYVSSINDLPRTLLRLTRELAGTSPPPQTAVQRRDVPPPAPLPEKAAPTATEKPVPAAERINAPAPPVSPAVQPPRRQEQTLPRAGTPPAPVLQRPANVAAAEHAPPPPVTIDENNSGWAGYGRTLGNSKQVVELTLVEISGEYRCDNCGTTRMFCKGDIVDRCENRECFSLRTSFTLQFDLF